MAERAPLVSPRSRMSRSPRMAATSEASRRRSHEDTAALHVKHSRLNSAVEQLPDPDRRRVARSSRSCSRSTCRRAMCSSSATPTVAPLYLDALAARFGRRIVEAILPDGESHKTLANVARILDVLVANRFGRDCIVVALGGGVVGDMAGFAAACYQRGVTSCRCPPRCSRRWTPPSAARPASTIPGGKNLIGAFHQPIAVVADTDTLRTLPPRELRAGLAEVIKYGAHLRCGLLRLARGAHGRSCSRAIPRRSPTSSSARARSRRRSSRRDEREQGDRALLNLGHTFGHAIESATATQQWLHGEAVGAGHVMAARCRTSAAS